MDLIHTKIAQSIQTNPVMLFMKGTREAPQCGFSAQVVKILDSYGVDYATMNVLDDWDLREGIKSYSNWPTIPQLYIDGKFIGGCDITMEMHRKGDLSPLLQKQK
jgi:monothiol glutaredoxin